MQKRDDRLLVSELQVDDSHFFPLISVTLKNKKYILLNYSDYCYLIIAESVLSSQSFSDKHKQINQQYMK